MKKILAMMLALVMALSLAACGGPAGNSPATEKPGAETSASVNEGGLPYEGHTLYVANWQGYNSDQAYCEKAFEDATGAQVAAIRPLTQLFCQTTTPNGSTTMA